MNNEKVITEEEKIYYGFIIDNYNEYQCDLVKELKSPNMIANLAIAKIRDYNRKWNEEFPNFPDAFIKIFKDNIKDIIWPEDYKRALNYL